MKKRLVAYFCFFALCSSLIACGSKPEANQNNGELIGNDAFDEKKMVTVSGEEIDVTSEVDAGRLILDTITGVGIVLSEDICKDMRIADIVPLFQYKSGDDQVDLSFLGEKLMDPSESESASGAEEDIEKYLSMSFPLLAVCKSDADGTPEMIGDYSDMEEIGSWSNAKYYILYNKDIDENVYSGLTQKDKDNIKAVVKAIPEIKKNMIVFPGEEIEDNTDELLSTSTFSSFTAKDILGNEVTDEIIKSNDITMINIWATWCGPCVMEMEDLGRLCHNLPEGAGLMSICVDGDAEADFAQEILTENKCDFTTIVPTGDIEAFISEIYSFPTTLFVDSDGNVVDIVTDAMDMDGYLAVINSLQPVAAE